MAKQKSKESAEEQAQRFREKVQELIDAGELSPAEADEAMEKVMKKVASNRSD